MSKVTLQRITTFQNDVSAPAAFNANMDALEAIIDLLVSRNGASPNQMTDVLDMNGQKIINLPTGSTPTEPVTQQQLSSLVLSATSGSIVDGSVTEPKFANGAVSNRALADGSVALAKLAANSVDATKIVDGSVSTAELAANAVTLAKMATIADQTVLGNNSGSTAAPSTITFATLAAALLGAAATVLPGTVTAFAGSRVPTGYLTCDGSNVSRTTYSALYAWMCPTGTVTFTVGTSTVNWASHQIANWDRVVFTTTGTLPTGITAGTTYYARDVAAGTFKLSTTIGGAALSMSGSPTGTHTGQGVGFGLGDGSTTFTLPDLRGEFIRGHDLGRGVDTNRSLGASQSHMFQDHTHNAIGTSATGSQYLASTNFFSPSGNYATSGAITGSPGAETRPRNISLVYGVKT